MLEFNPNNRITAEEAIKDEYFDDIRLPEQEMYPPPRIDLSIDDDGKEDLSLEELRKEVVSTINELSSDNFDFAEDSLDEDSDY